MRALLLYAICSFMIKDIDTIILRKKEGKLVFKVQKGYLLSLDDMKWVMFLVLNVLDYYDFIIKNMV